MHIKIILLYLFAFISCKSYAQEIDLKKNDLLNGPLYKEQQTRVQGHPFLLDDKYHLSDVVYKGMQYKNLLLKYDILNQQIIYFQEIDAELSRFILLNLNFLEELEIRNNASKLIFTNRYSQLDHIVSKVKYYQVVYDGNIKYLKGSLKIIDKAEGARSVDKYLEKHYYYVIINKKAHRVKSRRDLVLLFRDQKKEIRSFIKKNRLTIKVDSHSDIIKLLVFCESLN